MAPRKRTAVEPSTRVTRSSTRLVNANSDNPVEPPKAKKPKKTTAAAAAPKEGKATLPPPPAEEGKTIVIEHCKQCNSFKTRALTVKEGLEKGVAGVNVVVNPEKPRRGCFEIREENGEKFISLLDMKRPFAPMKALDMDKVVSDIVEKIK
ncbi:PREDICTED: selenoprotein H-like [Ipomoea nil]|uniref:selenoprotein H-like n=1 Tax=Ipomoea nil TaxID=35883 RepID=UPI000901B74B|nr:PREDICTED: selenoprotein H-like [Ipomoea nil]